MVGSLARRLQWASPMKFRTRLSAHALTLLALSSLVAGCDDKDSKSSGNAAPPVDGKGDPSPATGKKFFLPTGEPDNTSAPRLEVDPSGNLHAVYPAYAVGGAYYAFCGADCAGTEETKVVRFETDGTTTNAMLALDAEGHPRVLFSAYSKIYYGSCDSDCGNRESWSYAPILDHGSDLEVTGQAFALDPQGRPRFVLHTYLTALGIGQGDPVTYWVSCDSDCTNPNQWTKSAIQPTDIVSYATLAFDPQGKAHLAGMTTAKDGDTEIDVAAYFECASDCGVEANWKGIGFGSYFTSEYEAVRFTPSLSMALTKGGQPRVTFVAKGESDQKQLFYLACDADCTADNWAAMLLSSHEKLDVGVDLALDAKDKPRVAYTVDYNILLASCDDADCATAGDAWKGTVVEGGSEMPPDQIFLYPNCNVSAWFLHSPSVALTSGGAVRVGYQARDISGGFDHPDNPNTECVAGTDMTWSRVAFLSSAQ